jgi:Glycosyl hydrolase family 65, N-terminal domain
VNQLLGSNNHYGSYRVLANLSIQIQGITRYTGYNRSLDLRTGTHTTTFLGNDRNTYTTATYCSYPAKVCIYRLSSTGRLPNVAIGVENRLIPVNIYSASCSANNVRFNGLTHVGTPRGMEYDLLVRLSTGPLGMPTSSCATNRNGTIVVTGSAYGREQPLTTISVVIGAGTDYDQTQGTTMTGYSFHGPPPGPELERVTAQASTKLESKLLAAHQQDYSKLMEAFSIELFDPWKNSQYPSEALPFPQLLDRYRFSAGISGNNKKRDLKGGQDVRYKAAIGNKATAQRPAQFTPPVPPTPAYTSVVAGGDAFPDFHFPTKLPPGVTPTGAIAWSTNGLATVTGDTGKVYTVTLTATAAAAIGTARPVGQLPAKPPMKEPKRVAEDDLEQESLQDPTATQGDPYVEALLFDYARHLFISSSRDNSLPPNLAGIWEEKLQSAWSGDYHANINLQMNHWFADQVGLGSLQEALWKFMVNTWVCIQDISG